MSKNVNYYSYSLANTKQELGHNQFSKAVYFTVHLVRVRKNDLKELETYHFGEYVRASASIKRKLVFDHLDYLNELLEVDREQKKVDRQEKIRKDSKRKPVRHEVLPDQSTVKSEDEVINIHFQKDFNRMVLLDELRDILDYDPTFDFSIVYIKVSNKRARIIKKIQNATHIKLFFGNAHEGRRDLGVFEIPKIFRNDADKVEDFAVGIKFDYQMELDNSIEYYGKRYFSDDEYVVINDVIDFGEHIYLDVYKTFSDKLGQDYYVRKFYLFYISPVSISKDGINVINKNKKKMLEDFKELAKYAFKRKASNRFIHRGLYSMDSEYDGTDTFIAQGVSNAMTASEHTLGRMYDTVKDNVQIFVNTAKGNKYLKRFKNVSSDGYTIENDLRPLEMLGAFDVDF